ncbi:hypothetical protein [Frankia sp. EAN1pec]|uniref:hypothetical protein n=1 Tax=Parafrankia sp. (strain EAN1pec) TaxID=298653 RepID=UPI0000543667
MLDKTGVSNFGIRRCNCCVKKFFDGTGGDDVAASEAKNGDGKLVAGGEFVAFRPADSEDFTGGDDADRGAELVYFFFSPRSHSTPCEDSWGSSSAVPRCLGRRLTEAFGEGAKGRRRRLATGWARLRRCGALSRAFVRVGGVAPVVLGVGWDLTVI